ncbi:MAG: isoprenylcysteine carboxylmethyltransferase family protein [Bacteroidales bacterium]|nr:isoprenylcysteine carboxylmethyltransferase family protein [Bacteroidales bacterium]
MVNQKNKLFFQAFVKFLLGVVIVGLLLFVPAGSLSYWQGLLLMGILFVPMFCAGLVMMARNPELLRKRLNAKEEEKEQQTVVKLSGLLFIAAFVVAGLNWRFGWCVLPDWAVWVSAVLFLACYLLYAEVLRENTYLSRTIEVQENQKVIDTGLYGVVRHPMYMATTVLFLAMPLVLASPISFAIMLLYIPLIAKRIQNEEKVLEAGLDGYKEYKTRVKYKVIPLIW